MSPSALAANTMASSEVLLIIELVGACAVGILGITGVAGFAAYFVLHLLGAAALLAKMGWAPQSYFPGSSPLKFLFSGMLGNLLPFLLFWTLSYAVIHMYA